MPTPDEGLTPQQREEISRLLNDSAAKQLTPLQVAFSRMTWTVLIFTLATVLCIGLVWWSKLPPVPPVSATAEEIAHYHELTEEANKVAEAIVETIFKTVLYPVLLLVLGIFVGRRLKPEDED